MTTDRLPLGGPRKHPDLDPSAAGLMRCNAEGTGSFLWSIQGSRGAKTYPSTMYIAIGAFLEQIVELFFAAISKL
jgi:hypothetical protein